MHPQRLAGLRFQHFVKLWRPKLSNSSQVKFAFSIGLGVLQFPIGYGSHV